MNVKGSAFLARKAQLIQEFGEKRWNTFFETYCKTAHFFRNSSIMPITSIPIAIFLEVNDAVLKEFYEGDTKTYWKFGEKSAEWAMTHGPYRSFLNKKVDLKLLIEETFLNIWKMYYSEGLVKTWVDELGNDYVAHIIVIDVPVNHIYFEYTVMGYANKLFELIKVKNLQIKTVHGPSTGEKDIYYSFSMSH